MEFIILILLSIFFIFTLDKLIEFKTKLVVTDEIIKLLEILDNENNTIIKKCIDEKFSDKK